MRHSFDTEPRLMALTEAEIEALAAPRTWMHSGVGFSGVLADPQARWSRHARHAAYWQMSQIVRRPR
jgi:hypothetical protein